MMGFIPAGSGQWLDMHLQMLFSRQLNHVAGARGPAIPESDEGIRGQRHFPVAHGTRAFAVTRPIGRKAPDRDAVAGRPGLAQTVSANRAAGNDLGDGPCQTGQGVGDEGFIRYLPGTGDDGSHTRSLSPRLKENKNTPRMRHWLSGRSMKICFNVGSLTVRVPSLPPFWSRNHVK